MSMIDAECVFSSHQRTLKYYKTVDGLLVRASNVSDQNTGKIIQRQDTATACQGVRQVRLITSLKYTSLFLREVSDFTVRTK